MIIHDIEQQSAAWFKLREKKITASHATAIQANGAGLKTYITGLMQEYYSTGETERYSGKDTDRGIELEDSAAFMYQIETGLEVQQIGFVEYNEHVGVSPDRFVFGNGLAEIKCPADKGYFQYLIDGIIKKDYIHQMQMQMMVCEKYWCDYVVYNPNFSKKIVIKRIEPDYDAWAKLEKGFKAGVEMMQEIEMKMEGIL